MPFNLGFGEMLVLAVVAVMVFGGRLPGVARKVGRGVTEFKRGMNAQLDELRTDVLVEDPPEDADSRDSGSRESGSGESASGESGPPADWEPPAQDKDCPGMN